MIGGIVGGLLGALLLLGILVLLIRRRRQTNTQTSSRGWFRRNTGDRGIGSAYAYDFGSLGSTGTAPDSGRQVGAVTEVSGPMDVTHVHGFPRSTVYAQNAGPTEDEYKTLEKRPDEGIQLVPVLPRRETHVSTSSGFMTPLESANDIYALDRNQQQSPGGGMEYLVSARPEETTFPIYASSTDHSHEVHGSTQSHDRNPSESSFTTDSHAALIHTHPPPPPATRSTESSDRRASTYDAVQVDRRPSVTQGRRKSGVPERSGSVRRKPVPVEAYDQLAVSPGVPEGTVDATVREKKFVLEVERPLSQ